MSNQMKNKKSILKMIFIILLILDIIGLISAAIALLPTFKDMVGNGRVMLVVFCILIALVGAVMLFEIIAKGFLIKNLSSIYAETAGGKNYIAFAIILLIFNFISAIFFLLSAGGEGATFISQLNTYLHIVASVAEIIAVFFYIPAVKKR